MLNDNDNQATDMPFNEYNASQIVPQKALLMKFNKLIKYLLDNEFIPSDNIITEEDIENLF